MQGEKSVQGTFIVIESADISGKSVQSQLLADKLLKENYQVEVFNFPRQNQPSGYFIREYLNGKYGNEEEVGPYTSSVFYALDRYEAALDIKKALDDGKVVIANNYTGSNMAEQGTKFNNTEERKGYYLWVDAIEFQMLRIPRPTLSLILITSPKTAQKKSDVYEDLCELFPKDFKQLDCVRDKKLLDVETIHKLIWETVTPMLPPKKKTPTKKHKTTEIEKDVTDEATGQHLAVDHVSSFLAARLLQSPLASYVNQTHGNNGYYIPPKLDSKTKNSYKEIMDAIFALHSKMAINMTEYLESHSKVPKKERDEAWRSSIKLAAYKALQPILPVAVQSSINLFGPAQEIKEFIADMGRDALDESREVGGRLHAQIYKASTGSYQEISKPNNPVKDLARTMMNEMHSSATNTVDLSSVWPRNELDLIPSMLYAYSGLPIKQIQSEVASWSYDQKIKIFNAYLGKRQNPGQIPGPVLKKVIYTWDIVSDYGVYSEMQKANKFSDPCHQQLTPRYGFDVPKLIVSSNLTDDFEICFDLSLKLYSTLQSAGYEDEAQYATLFGHKLRWTVTFNGQQVFRVLETPFIKGENYEYRKIALQMYEKIAETHPLLAGSIEFINQS